MKFWNKLKKIFKSKTVWINGLMALGILIPRWAELPSCTLSPETTSFIVLIVNVALRMITNKPLEEK